MNELLFPRQKRLETLFYVMIAFALLGPTLGIPVAEFKLTFFRVAFVLLAGGIVLRLVTQKNLETSYMYPVRWYAAFFLFWFVYGVISLTWVVNTYMAVRYLTLMAFMLPMTLAFPYFIHSEEKFWKTSRVLFWVFTAIVFYGVFESITLIHLPSSAAFYHKFSASVTSVFHNQNDFASCITLALPFLITAMYMLKLDRKAKWFVYITGVLTLYDLLATGSRSNTFFALPLASLVLLAGLPFVMDRKKLTLKNFGRALLLILAALIIVNVMSNMFLSAEARKEARAKLGSTFGFIMDVKRTDWTVDDGNDGVIKGKSGESATVRKYLLLNGLRFLQKSHFMGVGAGNVEAWMKGAPKVNKVNMHNWWGEVLVDFGVIVFVLYMSLYFLMLWRLWKLASLKHSPKLGAITRWGAYSCMAALTGFFFGGMGPSTCIHFTPMWVAYGLGLAVIMVGENQKKKQLEGETA